MRNIITIYLTRHSPRKCDMCEEIVGKYKIALEIHINRTEKLICNRCTGEMTNKIRKYRNMIMQKES